MKIFPLQRKLRLEALAFQEAPLHQFKEELVNNVSFPYGNTNTQHHHSRSSKSDWYKAGSYTR